MFGPIHIQSFFEIWTEICRARLDQTNILSIYWKSHTIIGLVFIVVYFSKYHIVTRHQIMPFINCTVRLLTTLIVSHFVPINSTYQHSGRQILKILLNIFRKHTIWSLINLKTILSLFENLHSEVATFIRMRLLSMINIRSCITHFSHGDCPEISKEIPVRLKAYPIVLVIDIP